MFVAHYSIKSREQLLVFEMTNKICLLFTEAIKILLMISKLEQKEKPKPLKEELCSFGTTLPREMRAS